MLSLALTSPLSLLLDSFSFKSVTVLLLLYILLAVCLIPALTLARRHRQHQGHCLEVKVRAAMVEVAVS